MRSTNNKRRLTRMAVSSCILISNTKVPHLQLTLTQVSLDSKGFYCLVTELLGESLYDILKKNHHKGYPMGLVRDISRSLLLS